MSTIISVAVTITVLFAAVLSAVRNRKVMEYSESRRYALPRLLALSSVMSVCDVICGGNMAFRLLSDILMVMVPVYLLSLSLWCHDNDDALVKCVAVAISMMSVYYICCSAGVVRICNDSFFLLVADIQAVVMILAFMFFLWKRLRDVKTIVKSGNVWSYVTLSVDVFYGVIPLVMLLLLHLIYSAFPDLGYVIALVCVMFFLLELCALCFRISEGSAFVLMHEHERVIVESMKISHADASLKTDSRTEDMCKEIYERVQTYFETSRPYLDGNLTINDVVKVVYSNKVYISKAICRYTGRNFRQYVNYHRIMFSLEAFRERPDLKVTELAEMSGFNTVVTYTMAFRLFMNETPSEWCRKERAKISKQKK